MVVDYVIKTEWQAKGGWPYPVVEKDKISYDIWVVVIMTDITYPCVLFEN